MLKYVLGVFVALVLVALGFVWFSGAIPSVKLSEPVTSIGTATPVTVQVDDPHGVKAFTATVEQNGQSEILEDVTTASKQTSRTFTFLAGSKGVPFLKEGQARLIVTAKSNDLRGATTAVTQDVVVVLRPPTIVADGRQHYINQGGAELVTLDLGAGWTDAGVRVAKYNAGTFPMPGQPDNTLHRFSLFPFPWDVPAETVPLAFVKNAAGTEVTTTFWVKVFPKQFRRSNIEL